MDITTLPTLVSTAKMHKAFYDALKRAANWSWALLGQARCGYGVLRPAPFG